MSRLIIALLFMWSASMQGFGAQKGELHDMTGKLYDVSNSHINKICQDHLGYIWIATDYGLTRFDGIEAVAYTRTADAGSLLSNTVLTVMEDSRDNLWVGTTDGIQRFDRATQTFVTPRLSYPDVPDFSYVNSIIEDKKGNIWFTTSRSGVVCLRQGKTEPVCYMTTNSRICSNRTTILYEDSFGNIWIGSMDAGISVFNPQTNMMTTLSHDPADQSTLSSDMIFTIDQTNDGRLFIGSIDGGIDAFDYRTNRVTRDVVKVGGNVYILRNAPDENAMYIGTDGNGLWKLNLATGELATPEIAVKEFNLSKAKIHDILTDRQGNLWLAVFQKGALMVPRDKEDSMVNFSYNPFTPSLNIGTEPVLCALQSSDGALWIGTDGDGIYHADAPGKPFSHIPYPASGANAILTIFQDSKGRIWAGNYLNGLSRHNPGNGKFEPVTLTIPGTSGSRVKEVNTIAEDPEGNLWIGTNGNGVCVYNPESGATSFHTHTPGAPADRQPTGNAIHAILFGPDGKVWIGTSDAGLSCLDRASGKFDHYTSSNMRLSNNCVFSLCLDPSGSVWAATRMGLNRIKDNRTQVLNETHGLLNNLVYSIVSDTKGDLWLSTGGGISKLDPTTLKFDNRLTFDMLGCKEFKRGSACRGNDGRIYFGGVGGVVSFLPGQPKSPRELLRLGLNRLTVMDNDDSGSGSRAATTGGMPPVETIPLEGKDRVDLPYDRNSFTVSFGAVEFSHPESVSYSVMLDGHDNGWIAIPAGVHTATWSSLPPGDYTLRVKASISGYRPIEKELRVVIAPPFYLTVWAKIIYLLILAAIILLTVKVIQWRMRETEKRNRQLMQAQTAEHKLQFFTDISHEIRTPLTMILSPLESLRDKTRDKESLHTIDVMRQNGRRILRLIDQIMDLRRLDNNRMSLEVKPTAIRDFINNITGAFANIAEKQEIDYSVTFSDDLPDSIPLDADKVDKVVFNVLSNAFKFTPQGGKISLSVSVEGKMMAIRVADSGPGIPPENRDSVFNRFFQVKDASPASAPGTGIGLHLARKMTGLHHGSITIEDSSSQGSVFLILLPISQSAYSPDELLPEGEAVTLHHQAEELPEQNTPQKPEDGFQHHATVLVIEDDPSILEYLADKLSSHYNVVTASDGASGLETALTRHPDLILTDIMMDGLDGLELCRKIKANPATSEIPVVMLTAKVTESQRDEGFLAGADAYVTKPFNISHLLNRVNMLIHQRRMLKEKYSGDVAVNEDVVKIKSNDERLFERVRKVVVEQLANPELSVEYIAKEIGVSRSHLQRRMKVSANMNPSEFIKRERMRHASMMLTDKEVAISEVAYATGFSTLSHFSTCFREHFGMSPTRYVALRRGAADTAQCPDSGQP